MLVNGRNGAIKIAAPIKIIIKILLIISTLLFIINLIFDLISKSKNIKYACAATSKMIKANKITLLVNLYKSASNLMPRKIECIAKKTADKIPQKNILLIFL